MPTEQLAMWTRCLAWLQEQIDFCNKEWVVNGCTLEDAVYWGAKIDTYNRVLAWLQANCESEERIHE